MSIQIQNALGILSSDVPTGNLLWVDKVNGVDKLAARGRATIPFRTLTAAKDAAMAGDTIMVLPGTYNETNLAKDGVNWHFCNGAIVDYTGDSEAGTFASPGSPCSFKVTGHGVFKFRTGSTLSTCLIGAGSSDDVIHIECERLESGGSILDGAGTVTLRCDSMRAYGFPCVLSTIGPCDLLVIANEMVSTATEAIVTEFGSVEVHAGRISSTAGNGITFRGGSVNITAREILSATDYAVECDTSGADFCRIHNARLVSGASGKEAVYVSEGSENLGLMSCALIGGDAGDPCIEADAPGTKVLSYGFLVGNGPVGDNIELRPPLFSCDEELT